MDNERESFPDFLLRIIERRLYIDILEVSAPVLTKLVVSLAKKYYEGGAVDYHISPGVEFWNMTADERADIALKWVLDPDRSKMRKMEPYELDRPNGFTEEEWRTFTPDQRKEILDARRVNVRDWLAQIEASQPSAVSE